MIKEVSNDFKLMEGTLVDFVFAGKIFRTLPGSNERYSLKINDNKVNSRASTDEGVTRERARLTFPVHFKTVSEYNQMRSLFGQETVSSVYVADTSSQVNNMIITSIDRVRGKTVFPIKCDVIFTEFRVTQQEILGDNLISPVDGKKKKKQVNEQLIYSEDMIKTLGDLSPIQEWYYDR